MSDDNRSAQGTTFKRKVDEIVIPSDAVDGQRRVILGAKTIPPELVAAGVVSVAMRLYGTGSTYWYQGIKPVAITTPLALQAVYTDHQTGTTPVSSGGFTPLAGDLLVCKLSTYANSIPMNPPTGGGLTWTKQCEVAPAGFFGYGAIYTAIATGAPMTVTATPTASAGYAMTLERWSGAAVGNVAIGHGSGVPSTAITTTQARSVVSWMSFDDNSIDPATRAYLLSATEDYLGDFHAGSNGVWYSAYATINNISTVNMGLSAPTGQAWTLAGIEIKEATSSFQDSVVRGVADSISQTVLEIESEHIKIDGTGAHSWEAGVLNFQSTLTQINYNDPPVRFASNIHVTEKANGNMGRATLVGGTAFVNNNVIANGTCIFLTIEVPSGTVGSVYISSRTPGLGFTITSTSALDTSTVAWLCVGT